MNHPLFGAQARDGATVFRIPRTERPATLVLDPGGRERRIAMEPVADPVPHLRAVVEGAGHGERYGYALDGGERVYPDPASAWQPDGVHAPSAVWVPSYAWRSTTWRGRAFAEHVFYELHVGTFSPEGTYDGVRARLDALVELGVTAIELMPLAAFPGARGWGYDGVFWYAPFAGYGTPDDLRRLVDDAHARGLCVFLDVVYNHFGPEGNYLPALAPHVFDAREHTPWGAAIDYRRPDVRRFAIDNARWWVEAFRFDGLRLDAVLEIRDRGEPSVLDEIRAGIAECAARTGRLIHAVVENDANDATLLRDGGFDAQWNDDVHHTLHVLATAETDGYYADFAGAPGRRLARALAEGFVYQGEPSGHRDGAPRGTPSGHLPPSRFIDFAQNHDQIGNRAFGERLAMLAPPEACAAVASLVLLSPHPPLLFMGEEWAASTPFLFFCDFGPELARAVREGREREFARFARFADPAVRGTIPDATDPATFERCRLRWNERAAPPHAAVLARTRDLLALRAAEIVPLIARIRSAHVESADDRALAVRWTLDDGSTLVLDASFGGEPLPPRAGRVLDAVAAAGYQVRWLRGD